MRVSRLGLTAADQSAHFGYLERNVSCFEMMLTPPFGWQYQIVYGLTMRIPFNQLSRLL